MPCIVHPGCYETNKSQGDHDGRLRADHQRPYLFGSEVQNDLEKFENDCDLIIANRWNADLVDIAEKVYTCDLFKCD